MFQRKKDGRWVARVSFRDGSGKLRVRQKVAQSEAAANIFRREMLMDGNRVIPVPDQMTLGELIDAWMSKIVTVKYAPSTVATYEHAVESLMKNRLYGYRLHDFSALHVDAWIADLTKDNIGGGMQEKAFRVLSAALTYAVDRKLILLNPCSCVDAPKPPGKEIFIFTDEEVVQILESVKEKREGGIFQIAFRIGLRQGEIFGLQWPDLNLADGTLFIQRQASETSGKVDIRKPKTLAGTRRIHIDPSCLDVFHERKVAAMKEGLAGCPWIFPTCRGEPHRRSNFGHRHWAPLLRKLNLAHRGFHHARHTAATMMLTAGINVHTVSQLLGHSSPNVTYRVYSHWVPKDGIRATAAIHHVLFGSRVNDALMTKAQ